MHELRKTALSAATLAVVLGAPFHAAAQAIDTAGRVISVRPAGSATILRRGGALPARHGALLRPGDTFRIVEGGVVTATVHGKDETYSNRRPDLTIPKREIGWFGGRDEGFLQSLERFIDKPRRSIPVFPFARGDGPPRPPLTHDPIAPGGRQYVLSSTRQIALIWRDGSAELIVEAPSGERRTVDSLRNAWIVVDTLGEPRLSVSTADRALSWTIETATAAPAPPWFEKSPGPLSEAQRLVRATWLIQQGDPSWRLFALSELRELAEAGNFVAGQLWQGVRSGEWPGDKSDGQ